MKTDGGPITVLVVEDEPIVARAARLLLRRAGADATLADSLAAAREVLEQRLDELGAALVDVGLPDGSGLELVDEIRRRLPDLPIVLMSGLVDAARLADAHRLDVWFLLKPFDGEAVARLVERARERRDAACAEKVVAGVPQAVIEDGVEEWGRRYNLAPMDRALLTLGAQGVRRKDLAAHRGVAEETIKKQVRQLLKKTGDRAFSDCVNRFLRDRVAPP